MKFLPVFVIAGAAFLQGCASDVKAPQNAEAGKPEESYLALGSNIPRKGKRSELAGIDLQQLDNARTMGSANLEGKPLAR